MFDCPFGGPYRGRTGDLHNAIVALSQTELTARFTLKIYRSVRAKSIINPLRNDRDFRTLHSPIAW